VKAAKGGNKSLTGGTNGSTFGPFAVHLRSSPYAAWLEEQSEAARETIALRVVHESEEPPKQIVLLDGGRFE
jgi:hypothetical protein